jgi:hypothetical protein
MLADDSKAETLRNATEATAEMRFSGRAQKSGSVFPSRSTIASSKPVGVMISILICARRCAAALLAAINQRLEWVFAIPI